MCAVPPCAQYHNYTKSNRLFCPIVVRPVHCICALKVTVDPVWQVYWGSHSLGVLVMEGLQLV